MIYTQRDNCANCMGQSCGFLNVLSHLILQPFAWQSREYLRRLLIGKEVKFAVEYKVPVSGREYGTVWTKVNGEEKSVNELVVSEGWADVRQGGRASE